MHPPSSWKNAEGVHLPFKSRSELEDLLDVIAFYVAWHNFS